MNSHSQRRQIANEVHARPFQQLTPPIKVLHFAVMIAKHNFKQVRESLSELFKQCGANEITPEQSFYYQQVNELSIRWEAHTEYYTLAFYYSGKIQNWQQSIPGLPSTWDSYLLGEVITGAQLLVKPAPEESDDIVPEDLFGESQVIGSNVMRGAGSIWTDFRGFGEYELERILVHDNHLHSFQCGRLIQRLCEINTYRALALLSLAPALETITQLANFEIELGIISNQLRQIQSEQQSTALHALMSLAAQLEEMTVATENRFSASDAYYAMLTMRLTELEESRVEGLPTMEQFIERRTDPAMRTWRSAASRRTRLSKRVSQASNLLRSTIDLSTDQKVHNLLNSMNKRTRRQLMLQAKLETFSIIVVTYYIFDLIERSIRQLSPVQHEEIAINWLNYSLPIIIIIVWWYVRKVTKEFKSDD